MAESTKSTKKSVFETLSKINVNDHTEQKGGLTYLSWAWAWAEIKKAYPEATYTIYENADGWNYHSDGRTAWVKTGVTVQGIEMIEYLPVMDYKNRSIPLDSITSFDVNKAIQRSLTKACARHGLGLYIYAGEDLPQESPEQVAERKLKGQKVDLPTAADFDKAVKSACISDSDVSLINTLCKERNKPISKIIAYYKVNALEELTAVQAQEAIKILESSK